MRCKVFGGVEQRQNRLSAPLNCLPRDVATAMPVELGLRQSYAYSLPVIRDQLRLLTVDRRPLPEIVSGQSSAVGGQRSGHPAHDFDVAMPVERGCLPDKRISAIMSA